MARRLLAFPVPDEWGNRLGGSGTEVRIYTDADLTGLAVLYSNGSTGAAISQPLTPNTGAQTSLTVATLVGDTTITVASVTGLAVGHVVPIYNGTVTRYKVITAINATSKVLTLDSAIGTAFATSNTMVGNADMVGIIWTWIDDATDWYLQTKNVASTRVLPPIQIPARVPGSSIGVLEEGAAAGTRVAVNFIGSSVTAVDNAGANRVDVTLTGKQADGTVAAPSIGFVSDPDTGFYRVAENQMAAAIGGVQNLLLLPAQINAYGALYAGLNLTDGLFISGGTGVAALSAYGGSANVNVNLVTKGTGVLQVNGVGLLTNTTSVLGANVLMTVAATWYDGTSVTLSAGTWLITATITINVPTAGAAAGVAARIWDGTTVFASSAQPGIAVTNRDCSIALSCIRTVTGTPSFRIAGYVASNTDNYIASSTNVGAQTGATQISAVRLGA